MPIYSETFDSADSSSDFVFADAGGRTSFKMAHPPARYGTEGADLMKGSYYYDRLYGLGGDDTIYGGAMYDLLVGGEDNDRLYGEGGNDVLRGDAGMDFLSGGDGNDYLDGGAGNDSLFGGAGNDILHLQKGDAGKGNSGADTFEFRFYGAKGNATVTDFSVAEGDKAHISTAYVGTWSVAKTVGDVLYVHHSSGHDYTVTGLGDEVRAGTISIDALFA